MIRQFLDWLFSSKSRVKKEYSQPESFVALYLRVEHSILLTKSEVYGDTLIPILLPISSIGDVAEELKELHQILEDTFSILPNQIIISLQPHSLMPFHNATYYKAVAAISSEQAHTLESKSESQFSLVSENYIYLNSDSNFLYQLYTSQPTLGYNETDFPQE